MNLFQVDTVEQARKKMLDAFSDRQLETLLMDYRQASGYVLAEDLSAKGDIPGFDRSTVDGYAVRAADTAGAGESIPAFLHIVGSVEMGEAAPVAVGAGECVYVPTGGMLPEGADAVVMVEYCERFAGGDGTVNNDISCDGTVNHDISGDGTVNNDISCDGIAGGDIAVYESVSAGRNLVRRGDDAADGDRLFCRGTLLRPQEIGVLAAAGITCVPVYQPFRMTIISTGDELVPPEQTPGPGQVRDLNTAALRAQAERAGFHIVNTLVLRDDETLLTNALEEVVQGGGSDIVLISGGSSQGEKDMTAQIIGKFAEQGLLTHGLAIKPGKPTILAYNEAHGCLLVGLPGHPVSAMLVFETLLVWLWRTLTGQRFPLPIEAVIDQNTPGDPGKQTLQLVRLEQTDHGYMAKPVLGKSGLITRLAQSDGYMVIGQNREGVVKGETVQVYLL